MTAVDLLLGVIVCALAAYALLAGADFGAGVWDLLARGRHADRERRLIAHALGPVWEANHVWLIFVIVATFSGFPTAFGIIARGLELPLALALAGIVLRGAAYVYRAYGEGAAGPDSLWSRVFAVASSITPFMLGVSGAALATGKITATSGPLTPFDSPFTLVAGVFAVVVTAFLAAVYLCHDAGTDPETEDLVPAFRRRALGAAAVAGVVSMALLPLLYQDAPIVAHRFTERSIPFVAVAVVCGFGSLAVIWKRHYVLARATAATAVIGVLLGWAAAQYPDLAVGAATARGSAAGPANLHALLIAMGFGMVVILPAFYLLLKVFSGPEGAAGGSGLAN
ncbi:cytochrome bd ubiquinol oxidase subunit II [Catenulispora acidiphila DSM 44928]|uniref:Cytochrome bd ubiquinol oxidase subunit II n=1 Tax=Catenulispora acidiphila (strain DSM 44928 / JCM 14897 / NBRC 102108 / NRRL B-24433 / ID139908) TaxID=479433 RepID=C7QJB4_CATAD|nr:cytochrome d ubiquinol oxidase subunit II [Catenulispora acidiphila]ACU69256.1 cytochrome bd ubiquinol oxidase subunit II [Catenulispora acidiphila DSM 44928]